MLQRLTINLSAPEQQALEKIAATELRDLREQARFILRQELTRRGLLSDSPLVELHAHKCAPKKVEDGNPI